MTEMKENQWFLSLNSVNTVRIFLNESFEEVPKSYIKAWMAKKMYTIEIDWHQIAPPLIPCKSGFQIKSAIFLEFPMPPGKKSFSFVGVPKSGETKIVIAVTEKKKRIHVIFFIRKSMRIQNNIIIFQ